MTFVTPEAIGVAGAEDPKLQSVAKCAHTHTLHLSSFIEGLRCGCLK